MEARNLARIVHGLGSLKRSFTRGAPRRNSFSKLARVGAMFALAALVMQNLFTAAPSTESIATFASNCSTPQSIFFLGDTVCAVATGSPLGPPAQRRIEWVSPDGSVFELGPFLSADPQSDSIQIPTTGPVGTWQVKTVDRSNSGFASAKFTVRDPNNANVDLWCPISAPFQVSPGSAAPFTVFVTNKGPNDAANVSLTVTVATNSTFQSETQESGPSFSCTNPSVGGTGSSTCTIATLPANTTAQLTFVFKVDPDAQAGADVSSTATVTSTTPEIFDTDNTFTASVTISPPTCELTCPGNRVEVKDPGVCGKIVTFTTPGGAGCGTVECSPPSGTVFPIGTTNVVCSGDSGGPCAFTVTIQDSQATITCPANVTVGESSPGIGFAVVNYPAPTISDNCSASNAACNPPSGSSFPVGTTTVTCQNDSSAGQATCTFTVEVTSQVCLLNCPDDIVTTEDPPGSGAKVVTYSNPTSSGCPTITTTCNPASGSSFPLGSTTVSCTAKDASNNTVASCSFTVIVNSATCAVNCPEDIAAPNAPGQCGAVVSYPAPTTSGNCGTVTCNPLSGSFFPVGSTLVVCTPQTGASCSFSVTVQDTDLPTITCPPNQTRSNPGACGAVVNYPAPTASDNCPGVTTACTPPSGSVFPEGTTTVTCEATDESGNTSTPCSFNVTVAEPPTISCPANITKNNDPGLCSAVVTYANATATDNCPGVGTPSCTPPSGSIFPKGTTTVTCTVSDASGNSSSCSFSVTINDTEAPAISCPASITLEPTCPSGAIATYVAPVGTDNCPGATTARTAGPASGTVFPIGTTTVTYTVTDAVGLTASCSFTVTVKTAAATIQDMMARVTALSNQGKLSGQQAQGLNSKLQAALDAVNNGQTNVACNKLNDFISQVTAFINNGTLTSADGQPLINSAAKVRNTLGCTNLGCS
jgi:uncharacterized repeat protein (TIGR01451 family)